MVSYQQVPEFRANTSGRPSQILLSVLNALPHLQLSHAVLHQMLCRYSRSLGS